MLTSATMLIDGIGEVNVKSVTYDSWHHIKNADNYYFVSVNASVTSEDVKWIVVVHRQDTLMMTATGTNDSMTYSVCAGMFC